MDLPNGLQPGDLVRCQHCSGEHPAEQTHPAAGTSYEKSMLYVTCGAAIYFVGTIGAPSRQPARRPQ